MKKIKTSFLSGAATVVTATLACLALDVNQATEAELDSIKGLGPSSTARILKARVVGPFKDWADFMQRVKGIKPATAKKLSDGGLAVGDSPYP
jgi:competence protein ComEA